MFQIVFKKQREKKACGRGGREVLIRILEIHEIKENTDIPLFMKALHSVKTVHKIKIRK
jgi:hypothetical protein